MNTTQTHPITVPGPPVTLSVSVGQLRTYLERKGWTLSEWKDRAKLSTKDGAIHSLR